MNSFKKKRKKKKKKPHLAYQQLTLSGESTNMRLVSRQLRTVCGAAIVCVMLLIWTTTDCHKIKNDLEFAQSRILDDTSQFAIDIDIKSNELKPKSNRCARREEDLDRCSAQLIAFSQSEYSYPNSMEELDSVYCPNFKKTVECIRNSTDCYKPFEKQIINWVLTSTRKMNYKRCKNESEKVRFLKLTNSCFSSMKNPMDKCMNDYIASLEAIADSDGAFMSRLGDGDIEIQLACCANRRFKQCVMTNAKDQCRPVESLKKLRRTNSVSSHRVAKKQILKATADMMEDLSKTLDGMALTGPELICLGVDEKFCQAKFNGRFSGRTTKRHKSLVPAMLKIYSNK